MRGRGVIANEAGVTMTELFITMVVLGLVAAVTLPMVGSVLQDTKGRGAAEQIVSAFRQGRQNAISTAASYVVTISGSSISITCTDNVPAGNVCPANRPPNSTTDVVTDATLTASTSTFTMAPNGSATVGTVTVQYGTGSIWQVSMNPTGGVKLCETSCP